ncbi:DNA-directed RNA polymerase subunit beta' [uncultured Dialister sp.]|uniref:DNA-directed RNA polymerase subunit beta' n=1 Tax=uncultured Dialister sp. TaxID=278064 RepID=UPI0025DBE792|nr:DNA-directed RNA polymerase subunit beta' [uncultured Dialister sp.]
MLDVNEFDSMKIGIASPEKILEWSHGEVTKPETINYRTLKAETDGLFCEKIFGPTKDWECKCGKYKKMRYRGTVCDKCGVEVTSSKVRRERMGHIQLACPVSHIWYFKGTPSRIGLILEISPRQLERVLYFAAYIVIDPGETNLLKKQVLNEQEYQEALATYGKGSFKAQMGAEAIQKLLKELDLKELEAALKKEIEEGSGQRRVKCIRRLEEVEAFLHSGNKPEWMILTVLPVIPPELRPMVQLDGGRFATSDLNDLYRRVINRNNRLKRLMELGAPEIIIRNEKRMLQEAVDALIDNGRRGRAVSGPGNRPLKSLSDMLKGKQGRFRQNLLGKRVDYSGRSVIVVGPELKMYQCGLPKAMAIELFKPFIMHELIKRGVANNLKAARKKVDKLAPEVWDVLGDVIKEHPVLLNRAPTLHRLGIQAFEPILWEGRAIKLHPLVCPGYNADFDGDQMACHLPLSVEAQAEARTLMLSINNILSTKDGKPVAIPSQDMILGSYYLTIVETANDKKVEFTEEEKKANPHAKFDPMKEWKKAEDEMDTSRLHAYIGYDEVMLAYALHEIRIHDFIKVRIPKEDRPDGFNDDDKDLVITTPGRLIFNYAIPRELRFFYKRHEKRTDENGNNYEVVNNGLGVTIGKKQMGKLVNDCFKKLGFKATGDLLDSVKALGFHYALVSGISIGIYDVAVPPEKNAILADGDKQVEAIKKSYRRGFMTNDERYKQVVSVWSRKTDEVGAKMKSSMVKFNPLTMMAQSGARGNDNQIRQLAGMRGLIADTSGKTVELPVKANFREGLTVLDYFTSSHGARKGLADTALRTADSGYLTRRLVDVSQDVIVREEDCDVQVLNFDREQSIIASQPEVKNTIFRLKPKLLGAVLDEDVIDRRNGNILLVKGKTLDADDVTLLNHHLVESITVVIPSAEEGDEAEKPQTFDLGTADAVKEYNRAMRHHLTVHFAGKKLEDDALDREGRVVLPAGTVIDAEAAEKILSSDIPVIRVRMDQMEGVEVTKIDDNGQPIESLADRIAGRCPLEDVVNPDTGEVIAKKNEEITDDQAEEIQKYYDKLTVRSILTCHSAHGVCAKCYGRNLATGRHVEIGEAVGIIAAQSIGEPGTQLTMRTFHTGGVASAEDITQGLPRVEELFEARKPKGNAIISRIAGTVSITNAEDNPNVKVITITNDEETESEKIPVAKKISVTEGQHIESGTRLFEGNINPHDILAVLGVQATQNYIVKEVQKVYRSQGVEINDKHIEIIVHQMLRKIKIIEPGDSGWLPGETVDIVAYRATNGRLEDEGRKKAVGENLLLGTTKAALATDSFLSAASFQETTRVLTEAAIKGKEDPLLGLKENVIIGKLIPAGTGMSRYRKLNVVHNDEPAAASAESAE